jgi:hypothetical protein
MQQRLNHAPEKMPVRQQTAEHPLGTIKFWMGSTHFLTKTLPKVSTGMSLRPGGDGPRLPVSPGWVGPLPAWGCLFPNSARTLRSCSRKLCQLWPARPPCGTPPTRRMSMCGGKQRTPLMQWGCCFTRRKCGTQDFAAAFEAIARERPGGMLVLIDALVTGQYCPPALHVAAQNYTRPATTWARTRKADSNDRCLRAQE